MTIEEKALSLIDKYEEPFSFMFSKKPQVRRKYAKQLAIMAVEDIIESWPRNPSLSLHDDANVATEYWKQVKEHIENL